ncbi:hypothetical protein Y032_0013g2042 [Ancylostoma ceylanicum]|uniref:Uncharacterized protein n=1 Tax=Ancylostoma ceylanicum TaxID=53326 RepID=A0A016VB70_9BILA|nr:hypothetical protein Y032_0013g2042 [Ancylostoma ceylanicum]
MKEGVGYLVSKGSRAPKLQAFEVNVSGVEFCVSGRIDRSLERDLRRREHVDLSKYNISDILDKFDDAVSDYNETASGFNYTELNWNLTLLAKERAELEKNLTSIEPTLIALKNWTSGLKEMGHKQEFGCSFDDNYEELIVLCIFSDEHRFLHENCTEIQG